MDLYTGMIDDTNFGWEGEIGKEKSGGLGVKIEKKAKLKKIGESGKDWKERVLKSFLKLSLGTRVMIPNGLKSSVRVERRRWI